MQNLKKFNNNDKLERNKIGLQDIHTRFNKI